MSAPTDADIQEYYNRCIPNEPLDVTDNRYVDIDADLKNARGRDLVSVMARQIKWSRQPVLELFTGLPGSGKSTELKKLATQLENRDGLNLLTIRIDAEQVLDIGIPIDIPDILVAILYHTERAVLKAESNDPENALVAGPFTRLWDWLNNTDVELKGFNVGADVGVKIDEVVTAKMEAKASIELKTNDTLRQKVRNKVNAHMTTFIGAVKKYLEALNERSKNTGRAGICILFDSLEKLRGGSTNWTQVLDSAERIFSDGAPYLRLPVHVVYTLPPALVRRLSTPVRFLPMLKIRDRYGERADIGFYAAREIVNKRIDNEEHQQSIFGKAHEKRIAELIDWSGGYPREIVRLLQEVILACPLDPEGIKFKRVLADAADQYRRTITTDAIAWLARVHVDKQAIAADTKHREIVDSAFRNNLILRYQNDNTWEDIHPAIRDMPQIEAAIKELQEERTKPLISAETTAKGLKKEHKG